MKKLFLLVAINVYGLMVFSQTNPFASKFPAIDKYIDSTLKEWNVPGLTMSIVYKDQLIYAKGYGFRNLENKLPVETNTLFPIASNTKLFTATIASVLHHEGKLSLDKPVKNYLPGLNFSTDELNAKTTIRDMLSHRTGLPRYDGIWVNASFTRKEMVTKISYMKPQLGFREGYIYNNMMFVAAGAAIEEITGKTWEIQVREKIFQPLQMNASCFTNEEMKQHGNYSLAYFLPDSTRKLLPKKYEAQCLALGPAGTIRSTANDMGNWMIAQLNAGKFKGQQSISAKAIAETMIPNNISDKEGKYDELSNAIYCMGRNIYSYKGHKVTSHGGAIDGFYSFVTLFLKDSIGIFVAVNANHGRPLSNFIPLDVFDRLMNLPLTPWNDRYMKEYKNSLVQVKKTEDSIKATQVKNTVPSHALKDYTGIYNHTAYGDIKIELENNKLIFLFRSQRSVLEHFHYDQFATNEKGKDIPDFTLNFLINGKGEIDRISTKPFGDPLTEFARKKE
jgi:CubicO group peptidase (beta-lactamase class C family)